MFRSALRSTLGLTGVTGLLSAGLVLGTTAPALADDACQRDAATVTCTYSFTGGEQVFVVPAGVSLLDVTAIGGTGGRALGASSAARPVRVAGELPVQPGQTLVVSVGGDGGVPTLSTEGVPTPGGAGGFNGGARGGSALGVPGHVSGAGGGGASDVRLISRTEPGSLESRLLVAAGSGGASAADGGAGDPTAWTYAPVADVEGTDVDGTDVEGADVEGADVEGADVEGADVEGADVEGADVEGADVEGADV
ncbi:pentapeptide repeat-containing protein, partial [Modestobacter sp. SYSU DS0903]